MSDATKTAATPKVISRRRMLMVTAVSAVGVGLSLSLVSQVRAYRLQASGSCSKCKACKAHAQHKWFASMESVTRAHPYCKCLIVAVHVSVSQHEKMFASNQHFDMRHDKEVVV